MLGNRQILLRSLVLTASVFLLVSPLAAQAPTSWPEPLENVVTPRSVQDDLSQKTMPQADLGNPLEAAWSAVRIDDHYLVITAAVCGLPQGTKGVDLYHYGSAKFALLGIPEGAAGGVAKTPPFSTTYVFDLNRPGAEALRKAILLSVVQPGGNEQSVMVQELRVPSRD